MARLPDAGGALPSERRKAVRANPDGLGCDGERVYAVLRLRSMDGITTGSGSVIVRSGTVLIPDDAVQRDLRGFPQNKDLKPFL
jgi:hypothetical protein